jgi:Lrp/AsnC family transcriptional regulator, leucine-responsive regulatory protein
MRLSDKESKILIAAENNANLPMSDLQRITGLRAHTIRYCLQRMQDRGIIRYYPLINVYPLGYTPYSIYFTLAPDVQNAKAKLLKLLMESSSVSWISEVGGKYQFCMDVLAREIHEVFSFIDSLSDKLGSIFLEKAVATQVALTIFRTKYLYQTPPPPAAITCQSTGNFIALDEVDQALLFGLINNEYTSMRDLGRQISIPPATMSDRLKKLNKSGVIVEFIYLTNPAAFGMQSYKLLVSARGSSGNRQLFNFCHKHPNIVVLIKCVGSWDYEISVEVENAQDITRITQDLCRELGSTVSHVETIPLFKELKIACYPFLPECCKAAAVNM